MGIMSDEELMELGEQIITPFQASQVNKSEGDGPLWKRLISWGVSSYGYDVRVSDEYLVYHNLFQTYIDPKNIDPKSFTRVAGDGHVFIPPNSFALTETIEYVRVPRNCLVLVAAKSTYARVGLVVNATLLEPEWEGTVTLELSNTVPLPVKVYSGEGIVQLIFFKADKPCRKSYADRQGKYMFQNAITLPKV